MSDKLHLLHEAQKARGPLYGGKCWPAVSGNKLTATPIKGTTSGCPAASGRSL